MHNVDGNSVMATAKYREERLQELGMPFVFSFQ